MIRRNRLFVVLASGFVLLGMAITTPGVAWPSIAESFDRPLAELGLLTLIFGGSYTVSSSFSGRLVSKWGIGPALVGAAATALTALVGLSASPSWPAFLFAVALLGLGGGLADAATNTYVALRRGARAMGLIHGVFGIGAIAGPLVVTVLFQLGLSWRVSFAVLALGQLVYVAALWRFSRDLSTPIKPSQDEGGSSVFKSGTAVWSILVFFVYAGIGAGAGAWAFTFLTVEGGIGDGAGGLVVAGYWGGFTASRLLIGALGDRLHPDTVLRWAAVFTAAAFAVLWLAGSGWIAAGALVLAGFAHGPIFPLEMLLTARRFEAAVTSRMVGFEVAAANVGGALLPFVMG
ncbi:MAG: MFS transporter, partial [Acidimicrobiia bacterium]